MNLAIIPLDIIRIPLAQSIRTWHENLQLCKIRFIGYLPPARFPHVTHVHYGKRADVIYSSNSNFTVPDFEIRRVNLAVSLRKNRRFLWQSMKQQFRIILAQPIRIWQGNSSLCLCEEGVCPTWQSRVT